MESTFLGSRSRESDFEICWSRETAFKTCWSQIQTFSIRLRSPGQNKAWPNVSFLGSTHHFGENYVFMKILGLYNIVNRDGGSVSVFFNRYHRINSVKGINSHLKLFFYLWTDFAEIWWLYANLKKKMILFSAFFDLVYGFWENRWFILKIQKSLTVH